MFLNRDLLLVQLTSAIQMQKYGTVISSLGSGVS